MQPGAPYVIEQLGRELQKVLDGHAFKGRVEWKQNAKGEFVVAIIVPASETVGAVAWSSTPVPNR